MRVATAVVAHSGRAAHAYDLAATLGASIAMDDGTIGPGHNHLRAWTLTRHGDWALVIEDDAILATNFTGHLHRLLPTAPTPIVSLYLGTNYPPHLYPAALEADEAARHAGEDWATLPTMNHAVAIAIRGNLVDDMIRTVAPAVALDVPIDRAIGDWAAHRDTQISYTCPSLVDHRDEPTLIAHPDGHARSKPRKAIRFAG